jgi:hypothetical protein
VATNDKGNVIDLYTAVPEYTYPIPHPGWDVDRPGGYWDRLDAQ